MKVRARIVIDESHSSWVLGGIFNDIFKLAPNFFYEPVVVNKVRSFSILRTIISVLKLTVSRDPIIFSSITPYENFLKINPFKTNLQILWFTHFDQVVSQRTINLIKKADLIFVHSERIKSEMLVLDIRSKIVVVTGAISPELFSDNNFTDRKIAWIGTTAPRKNAHKLVELAKENQNLFFKVLGKGWESSDLFCEIQKLPNIEYVALNRAVNSIDLNGCSHFLMLSDAEGGPISLLETLAAGLIPICTDVGIVGEVLPRLGYKDQILMKDYTNSMVLSKYYNTYSIEHIKWVSSQIKFFTFERLSNLIRKEIIEQFESRA
jgi:glycosyltransferase involved in cell wall biosynthesis